MNRTNKKIKNLTVLLSCGLAVFFSGCKEEGRVDHIDGSAPAPAQLRYEDITVNNTAGGAVLRYKLPADDHLLYIRAEYEIRPGVMREAKSSYFIDSLVLEGFGDTRTYDVRLYSVGKNEKASEPVMVQVNPTKAPVHLATKSLKEVFGGVSVSIENPEKAALAVVLMSDTSNIGYMSILQTFYTAMPKATFAFRGLDSVQYNFAVYLRDRWSNFSDTVENALTPIYEEEITRNSWMSYTLTGDAPPINNDPRYFVQNLWNGNRDQNSCYFTENQHLPVTLTWDFGKTIIPSRFKLFPRNHPDDRWKRGHPKVFEVYGSMLPNSDGSLDNSWIPLGKFEFVKPTPGTDIVQEDIDAANEGFDFDFEISDFALDPFIPIRYIRFRILTTFNNTTISSVSLQEVYFWGREVQ